MSRRVGSLRVVGLSRVLGMLACYQVDSKKSTNQLATMSCLTVRTVVVLAPPSKCLRCLAGLNQPPLLGFVVRPSIDILDRDRVFVRVLPLAPVLRYHRRTRAARVVSHHLDGLSRERLARILHLAADHGVRCVSCVCQAVICQGRAVGSSQFPQRVSYPSKNPPRRWPYCVTAAFAFLPFVTCIHNTEVLQRLRRPGWAPIHRSGSPHIRPINAQAHRNGTSSERSHQLFVAE